MAYHGESIASGLLLDTDTIPEHVQPCQFHHDPDVLIGERELCRAILIQAVTDYIHPCGYTRHLHTPACYGALYSDALAFFEGHQHSTYTWVCGVLETDPARLWAIIRHTPTFIRPHLHPNKRRRSINGKQGRYVE